MKPFVIILFLTFNLCSFGQTQYQMHEESSEEYKKADTELDHIYQKILIEYKSDSIFINRLKKAQKIWIAYRDAELEMRFPAKNKQVEYGSVYPMCVALFLKGLTEERTEKLRVWINGIKEGDMCLGSIKTN